MPETVIHKFECGRCGAIAERPTQGTKKRFWYQLVPDGWHRAVIWSGTETHPVIDDFLCQMCSPAVIAAASLDGSACSKDPSAPSAISPL